MYWEGRMDEGGERGQVTKDLGCRMGSNVQHQALGLGQGGSGRLGLPLALEMLS